MVDIVVLNYNDGSQVVEYVKKIEKFSFISHIVIVDNSSTDNSVVLMSKLKSEKTVIISTDFNGGYGYGNNAGVKYAIAHYNSNYIAITNPDVEFSEDCIEKCVSFLQDNKKKRYAVVAPQMLDINKRKADSAWLFPTWYSYACGQLLFIGKLFKGIFITPQETRFADCDCVAGSMLVVDATAFVDVGMYDENIFLYCEEMVLGKRMAQKGYKTAVLGDCSFIHAHSISIKKSIKTSYLRKKTQWKSREYVLSEYYKLSPLKKAIVKFVKYLSLGELRIASILLGK